MIGLLNVKRERKSFERAGGVLNPTGSVLWRCDFQNLPQTHRWWTKADVRNVKRAIWAEGHGRGEGEP
jgi:hypothetical protein